MSPWKIVTLAEVANIERSGVQPEQIRDGTIYVGLEHIERGGRFIGLKPVDAGELASSKFQFTEQHILYGKLRPYLAKIACPEFSGICSTDILPILPRSNVDRKFLFHFLRQPKMVDYANSRAVGVNLPRLSPSVLANFEIPIPPLEEQRRIAEVLDRAQEIRSKRREAIAQLDTLTQAIFLEMFGSPDSILNLWKVKKLGDLLDFLTTGSRGWAAHYAESGDLFLRIQNVRWDELVLNDIAFVKTPQTVEARRTKVEPGDVLLSMTADLGRTAVIPEDIRNAYINQHLAILRTKSIHPQFLSSYFASPSGRRQVQGRNRQAVKAGLNFDDVRSFMIPCPPNDLQKEFAHRVEAVEKLKAAHRASLSELDTLFASLQHRAFRGEL
ncbi:MAG: restriction endonuclease subunit S [Nostoc sp.]